MALSSLALFKKAAAQLYRSSKDGEEKLLAICSDTIKFGNFVRKA